MRSTTIAINIAQRRIAQRERSIKKISGFIVEFIVYKESICIFLQSARYLQSFSKYDILEIY